MRHGWRYLPWLPLVAVVMSVLAGQSLAQPATGLAAPAHGGQIRALVIGIDNYAYPEIVPTLSGAVADARDIAGVLRRSSVGDLTTLIAIRLVQGLGAALFLAGWHGALLPWSCWFPLPPSPAVSAVPSPFRSKPQVGSVVVDSSAPR